MTYQPAEKLTNRSFVGLIIAQFLAGFNDQAIHAAAMFYAIHTQILSEANAITLMPVLFYSPWAIFCTLAGHCADRYSKTTGLQIWKFAEIGISLVMIAGFYFGSNDHPYIGGWLIMVCVFLMGTHAAFFAPAKYGAMPELLRDHVLSRGNGILESTTFLASILGTVSGGLLFNQFRDNPIMIGIIILVLSVIGSVASLMIARLPASSPEKPFPANLFKPLIENLKVMFRSRPLALAVLGIAFFIFMVAYMRASMYMHGETRNPRWDEQKTSIIVATVALGVGLGSPLAGYLSGGKVELGLVPLGCLGMIVSLLASALAIEHTEVLVGSLIGIGFFSGYYMVPLYTLLQHRAPKKSKGELVATSNFINVTGAIAASLLFNVLVQAARFANVTPEITQIDEIAFGTVTEIRYEKNRHGKIEKIVMESEGKKIEFEAKSKLDPKRRAEMELQKDQASVLELMGIGAEEFLEQTVEFDDNFLDVLGGGIKVNEKVKVVAYDLHGIRHFLVRKDGDPLKRIYDNESLPKYLFLGAALMTIGILILLCRKLPDFFTRMFFWMRTLRSFRLKAVGMHNLPTDGPVILGTNCKDLMSCLQLVSATDRTTKVILFDDGKVAGVGPIVDALARRSSLIVIKTDAGSEGWLSAKQDALRTLKDGHLLAINVEDAAHADAVAAFVHELREQSGAPLLPVFCGPLDADNLGVSPRVRVVFGEGIDGNAKQSADPTAIQPGTPSQGAIQAGILSNSERELLTKCKEEIRNLGVWIRANDENVGGAH